MSVMARLAPVCSALRAFALIAALAPAAAIAQPVIQSGSGVTVGGPPEAPALPAPYIDLPKDGANSFMGAGAPVARGGLLAGVAQGPLPALPVVVELYTAQGCSSCPPADALMAELAGRADLLALSFHVDYWDYLGWADSFASPAFTARQEAYAAAFGERGLYTPQMIVGGSDTLLTLRPADVDALIDAHRARPPMLSVSLQRDGTRHAITLTPLHALPRGADVLMLRYLPERSVTMGAGENRGRVLSYRNIVVGIERLAQWDGRRELRLTVSPGAAPSQMTDPRGQPLPHDTRHAIIVQQAGPGPILAAIRLD